MAGQHYLVKPFTPNLTALVERGPYPRSCVVEDARDAALVASSHFSSEAKEGEEDQEGSWVITTTDRNNAGKYRKRRQAPQRPMTGATTNDRRHAPQKAA